MRTATFKEHDVIPFHEFWERENRDLTGYIIVLRAEAMHQSYRKPEFQLWRCHGGFGAVSGATGRAVYGQCLKDDEQTRWNTEKWLGVIKPVLMPEVEDLIGRKMDWKEEKK